MNITTLISAKEISNRVSELGQDISNDYQGTVILISVLKGSICFMADLLRSIDSDVTIEFISISSYKGAMKGNISLHDNSIEDIQGKHVILVEDIVDSGRTLSFLIELLSKKNPKSIDVCTLLDKPARREVEIPLSYIGFEIDDYFVVGYGLDVNQKYRNLPYIGYIEQ
ncbi:MAG: hypoxanthine phosphoribosyltransferase [Chloroflexi bacterium]|nr:hypoxanthine phosphoribosyltransferase [Chloroflexota bacterium]MQG03972.1 hypoxanthine phosphoribosyltransferase [SAR202 cluster bacterium]HAE33888.1 hypoxanthine phosphoribosyltransferase [Dehalococcoidia bacterium]|tara:strand:+ start:58 stop:564 length:507 start_codon:yes stop_codon:yes gene_type:complete